jgi:glycosyltransferase involved in cell wall biosynthesis
MPNSVSGLFTDSGVERKHGGGFRFCHVSFLDSKKNVDALIRAFASSFRNDATVSLVIGGDGPSGPALQKLARDCGILRQVEFTGKLSRRQVRDVLDRSDAFVLPSRFETFGVVLIEATAMGLPVIATRCGGPEDIVTERNGILVPVGDTAALGAAMLRMYETRACWDRQSIRDECHERFGADSLARRWREIYAACAHQPGTPA